MKILLIFSLISLNLILESIAMPSEYPDIGIPRDWIEESPVDGPVLPDNGSGDKEGLEPRDGESDPREAQSDSPSNVRESDEPPVRTKRPKPTPAKQLNLCDEPVFINGANRFSNSTIRLYRGDAYWDLFGLPDRRGFTSEKFKLGKPFSPVTSMTSITTILEGKRKDYTYKFERQYFWAWDETDKQRNGGNGGEFWRELPEGGFDTVFHNGKADKPMFIGLKKDKVYYIDTKEEELEIAGNPEGHKGGRYGENFPKGVTAAFSWPMGAEENIMLYMFKEDKHCLRSLEPLESGSDCDEWRENSDLFGCQKAVKFEATEPKPTDAVVVAVAETVKMSDAPEPPIATEVVVEPDTGTPVPTPTVTSGAFGLNSNALVFSLIHSSMIFTIVFTLF